MSAALAAVKILVGLAVAATSVIALQAGLACRYDWSAIGASVLMLAWAVRWVLGGLIHLVTAGDRLRRTRELAHAVGLATAALLFASQSFVDAWWPFGWWPLAVGVLLAMVAVVCARSVAPAA